MGEGERDEVNAAFNQPSDNSSFASNCARLCDEQATLLLQAAGAHLHSIGVLLRHKRANLPPISVLARASIEACGRCMWLIDSEVQEVDRTNRALKIAKTRMSWLEHVTDGAIIKQDENRHLVPAIKSGRINEDVPSNGEFLKIWSTVWDRGRHFNIDTEELNELHDWVHSNEAAVAIYQMGVHKNLQLDSRLTLKAAALCALVVSSTTTELAGRRLAAHLEHEIQSGRDFSIELYKTTHELL
ncbi:hypothetical protein [Corynebacterium heidelbergense]|nr:hypothetical protein [Corynebacterium heidelbergense]